MKKYKGLTLEQREKRELFRYLIIACMIGILMGIVAVFFHNNYTISPILETSNTDAPILTGNTIDSKVTFRLRTLQGIMWTHTDPFHLECASFDVYQGGYTKKQWFISSLTPEMVDVKIPPISYCDYDNCSSSPNNSIKIKNSTEARYVIIDAKIDNFNQSDCFKGYGSEVYKIQVPTINKNTILNNNTFKCDKDGICLINNSLSVY